MEEYDEPLTVELRTDREVTAFIFATGLAAGVMEGNGLIGGAQALSNLQIRLASQDAKRVQDAIDQYSDEGLVGDVREGVGKMSTAAGIGSLADADERDPDEVTEGML